MPLALQYELSQSWRLSQNICDLWVSFDVTACTSSILNLCTISIGNVSVSSIFFLIVVFLTEKKTNLSFPSSLLL